MNTFDEVFNLIRDIPKGKVSTYGAIGKKLNLNPRVVGYALHANRNPDINPCHRVVNKFGRVAPGYAFGGPGIQKKLLEQEGVNFLDDEKVDLKQYEYIFT